MADAGAWPLPVDPLLDAALNRLMALGRDWAGRRGWEWCAVMGGGSDRRPLHRFRWEVVGLAVAFAAGRAAAPPADYAALPLGLQAFLRAAIPAAIAQPAAVAIDLDRCRRAATEADVLAEELAVVAARPPRGPGSVAAEASSGPPPAVATGDAGELLSSALGDSKPSPLPPGAAELLERLRGAPLSLRELRALALTRGTLPGTLLDALDAAAVRATGSPATRVEGNAVQLSAEYRAAVARGEETLG